MKILAHKSLWANAVEFAIIDKGSFATHISMQSIEPGKQVEPVIKLDVEYAQELMDSLWSCGLRPSEGTGSAGALAATQNHLKDLQKIVYNQLKLNN